MKAKTLAPLLCFNAVIAVLAPSLEKQTVDVALTPHEAKSTLPAAIAGWPRAKILPPKWGYFPRPGYPNELERCGVSGDVTVQFAVNEHGWVIYAEILKSSDLRFATSVLRTLRFHEPIFTRPPMKPIIIQIPLTFTPTEDSDVRDKEIVANVTTEPVSVSPLMFQRPMNFNPTYPGILEAKKLVQKGMIEIEVRDALGHPTSVAYDSGYTATAHSRGIVTLRYGDLIEPELGLRFENGLLVEIQQLQYPLRSNVKRKRRP